MHRMLGLSQIFMGIEPVSELVVWTRIQYLCSAATRDQMLALNN